MPSSADAVPHAKQPTPRRRGALAACLAFGVLCGCDLWLTAGDHYACSRDADCLSSSPRCCSGYCQGAACAPATQTASSSGGSSSAAATSGSSGGTASGTSGTSTGTSTGTASGTSTGTSTGGASSTAGKPSTGAPVCAGSGGGPAGTGGLVVLAGQLGGPGNGDGVGAAARFHTPFGAALDGRGNLLVADTENAVIRTIDLASGAVTTIAGHPNGRGFTDAGPASAAEFNGPNGLAVDTVNQLVYIADSGNNVVRSLDLKTLQVATVAGSSVVGKTDGAGSSASFDDPSGLAFDGIATLYVTDQTNNSIRAVNVATQTVSTLAGDGLGGSRDGSAGSAEFRGPEGLALDGTGELYVADFENSTIRQVSVATGSVTTLAGSAGSVGTTDGVGSQASFSSPDGLAWDGQGNLFVADSSAQTVREIAVATALVTTVAGFANYIGHADGPALSALFWSPAGVALDTSSGRLYVVDQLNNTVRALAAGAVTTLAGLALSPGSADCSGSSASFGEMAGLAYDGAGHVFVSDSDNKEIRQVDYATGQVTTLAGNPTGGAGDGIGSAASFAQPQGLAWDGAGDLFIADSTNNSLRKLEVKSRTVTTLAGTPGSVGTLDGIGSNARFNFPVGLCLDGAGNLIVADQGNDSLRVVALTTGVVTTLAGSSTTGNPEQDGAGTAASFAAPAGLACDQAGNVYVADVNGNSVRQVALASGLVTTLAGPSLETLPALILPEGIAYDPVGSGVLYVASSGDSTVRKIPLSGGPTASAPVAIGQSFLFGIAPGALPARINDPLALVLLPELNTLVSTSYAERVILASPIP